jgi:predicted membrane protein DUF2207
VLTASGDDGEPFLGPGSPVSLPFGLTVGTTLLLEIVVVAVATGLWFLLLTGVLAWTRPKPVTPGPADAELPGSEPPAVVSLLAGGWALNEDAVESTVLDLAARKYVELRQPGNDPLTTTVHLLPRPSGPPLTDYEAQVLAHVQETAVGAVVPLTALTFRDRGRAETWIKQLHQRVIADARARGLSRRRISPPLAGALGVLAAVPAGLLALAVMDRSGDVGSGPGAGFIAWGVLSAWAGRPLGERDTPAGREVAARWLGLREFLKNDEAFADLPPAAVMVWDRYLPYGDALGVTPVSAAVLDLGMGDRKRVWSSFGGQWHPVRIRYPKVWGRYGKPPWKLLLWAALCLLAGGWMLRTFGGDLSGPRADGALGYVELVPALLGLYLAGRGVYRIARTILDLAAPREIRGEVLWVELWRSTTERNNKPSVPFVHYLAVDDGTADRTTAWALPSEEAHRAHPGDEVTIVVHPWSRRVSGLNVIHSRRTPLPAAGTGPAPASTELTER